MALRRRKKALIDEGPLLFTEEEMAGKIKNVTIVQTPEPGKTTEQEDSEKPSDNVVDESQPKAEPLSDERMIAEMKNVLRQMDNMSPSQIRLIALTTTMKGQNGLDLNQTYIVPSIKESDITGYELAAWCYCSFMEAFPQMEDKLQMPYADHYDNAKANIGSKQY